MGGEVRREVERQSEKSLEMGRSVQRNLESA